jgi:hypothetical protein
MHSNGGVKDDLANFILRHNLAPLRLCGKMFFSEFGFFSRHDAKLAK